MAQIHQLHAGQAAPVQAAPDVSPAEPEELYLFTTATCPNCPIAKDALDKAGVIYQAVDVSSHMDLVRKYKVLQAPTLVVRHGDQVERVVNASDIRAYAEARTAM